MEGKDAISRLIQPVGYVGFEKKQGREWALLPQIEARSTKVSFREYLPNSIASKMRKSSLRHSAIRTPYLDD